MNQPNNTLFKTQNQLFDQTSFWLVLAVLIVFIAGTAFGRMTDSTTPNSVDTVSRVEQHHTVYGRFGSLHWEN